MPLRDFTGLAKRRSAGILTATYFEYNAKDRLMDSYHRQPHRKEQPDGRDCPFCAAVDPNFSKRIPIDRWIHGGLEDSATSHLSENGHVYHLMFKIAKKQAQAARWEESLPKSA
jgi:hypothetical protein